MIEAGEDTLLTVTCRNCSYPIMGAQAILMTLDLDTIVIALDEHINQCGATQRIHRSPL